MRNRKSTKYALVTSMISIFLCTVMLIGSTFAWFTDTAETSVNTIQSGTLDVAIYDDEGKDLEGANLQWIKAEGEDEVLWEPNCTYDLPVVNIVNEGNLALKYKVYFNGIDGDAELLDVIDFTVTLDGEEIDLADFEGDLLPGESEALAISGHMDAEAGNEYQNLIMEGLSITVQAAQLAYESDSIDNQYDANAAYADDADVEEPSEPEVPAEPEYDDPVDIGDDMSGEVVISGNFKGEYVVKAKKTVATVYLKDVVADVKNGVILEANNTVILENCDFTLPEGGKLVVDNNGDTTTQVLIANVTVNGDKIDSKAEAEAYMKGVENIGYFG